jgi:hypothetical protein
LLYCYSCGVESIDLQIDNAYERKLTGTTVATIERLQNNDTLNGYQLAANTDVTPVTTGPLVLIQKEC